MDGNFLSTIITQMGGNKSAMLSSDAPTINESNNNPAYISGNRMDSYDDKKIISNKPFISVNAKTIPSILQFSVGDNIDMDVMLKIVECNFFEDSNGNKTRNYKLKVVAAKI